MLLDMPFHISVIFMLLWNHYLSLQLFKFLKNVIQLQLKCCVLSFYYKLLFLHSVTTVNNSFHNIIQPQGLYITLLLSIMPLLQLFLDFCLQNIQLKHLKFSAMERFPVFEEIINLRSPIQLINFMMYLYSEFMLVSHSFPAIIGISLKTHFMIIVLQEVQCASKCFVINFRHLFPNF